MRVCVLATALLALAAGSSTIGGAASGELHGVVRADARPVMDAVIWLQAPNAPVSVTPTPVLDQRNLQFLPQVLVVRVGTTVKFPNNDRVFHNVFSFQDGKKFDLGRLSDRRREVRHVRPRRRQPAVLQHPPEHGRLHRRGRFALFRRQRRATARSRSAAPPGTLHVSRLARRDPLLDGRVTVDDVTLAGRRHGRETARSSLLACARWPPRPFASAQTMTGEVSITGGCSTDNVAARRRRRGSSARPRRISVLRRGRVGRSRSQRARRARRSATAYPYEGPPQVMEAYGERRVNGDRLFGSVRAGRFRTPFGIYGGERPCIYRLPARAADPLRGLLGALQHVPRARRQCDGGHAVAAGRSHRRPAGRRQRGRATRRAGTDAIVRVQGYHGAARRRRQPHALAALRPARIAAGEHGVHRRRRPLDERRRAASRRMAGRPALGRSRTTRRLPRRASSIARSWAR